MTRNFEISEDKSATRHSDVVVTALNWLNVATINLLAKPMKEQLKRKEG